ncbi:MAG TPA: SIS domain-containing protein [Candidatus Avipropionibacterium avicola]|uniref:SIS domain-containing protein n=1 Tax=Candidatus Avipropionibacterium avicola TaxID=2840701 RepID=A0A9D1GVT3_9ACTN|nr:SIS domain-containing protein [Candidatus Avipropionibacterium avicola]
MTFFVEDEIASQPDCWQRAIELAPEVADRLPQAGERVAFVGCGTSWFMAQVAAAWWEGNGKGEADAWTADEFAYTRRYDRVVAITRSGTTSEVLEVLEKLAGSVKTTVLLGAQDTPATKVADQVVDLSFADEQSVVQTRFATTVLALLRAHIGVDTSSLVEAGRQALTVELPDAWVTSEQVTFVGRHWSVGLANEAALKFRESSSSWAESYPALDYRHGPISIASTNRLVWCFGEAPAGLADQVSATGATFIDHDLDPVADLVVAQRLAIARAVRLGLNPDQPRNLSRSVVLDDES